MALLIGSDYFLLFMTVNMHWPWCISFLVVLLAAWTLAAPVNPQPPMPEEGADPTADVSLFSCCEPFYYLVISPFEFSSIMCIW